MMKNVWIVVALICIAASAAVVGFFGSAEEDVPQRAPNKRPPRRQQAPKPEAAESRAKRLNLSGTGGGGGGSASPRSELTALLKHYRGNFSGDHAEQIQTSAASRKDRLMLPLAETLRGGQAEYLREAIALAGDLGETSLRNPLAELAISGDPELRPHAILAAERLKPWSDLELENFLRDSVESVVLAGLRVTQTRGDDRPYETIVQLMEHDSSAVRREAMRALPKNLAQSEIDLLVRSVELGAGVLVRNSMRVLARAGISDRIEAVLIDRLGDPEQGTRDLAMELLGQKKGKLRQPGKIWSIEWSRGAEERDHARALYCLERTRSFDVSALKQAAPLMPPLPRYFAARCLVSRGERVGVRLLLEIDEELTEKLDLGIEVSSDASLRRAVHRLLGFVSRTGPYATRDSWESWFERVRRFAPRDLGPHGLILQ